MINANTESFVALETVKLTGKISKADSTKNPIALIRETTPEMFEKGMRYVHNRMTDIHKDKNDQYAYEQYNIEKMYAKMLTFSPRQQVAFAFVSGMLDGIPKFGRSQRAGIDKANVDLSAEHLKQLNEYCEQYGVPKYEISEYHQFGGKKLLEEGFTKEDVANDFMNLIGQKECFVFGFAWFARRRELFFKDDALIEYKNKRETIQREKEEKLIPVARVAYNSPEVQFRAGKIIGEMKLVRAVISRVDLGLIPADGVVDEVLQMLSARQETVIRERFGLDGNGTHTYKELASKFNVEKERFRQIESMALRKLRIFCYRNRDKNLESYTIGNTIEVLKEVKNYKNIPTEQTDVTLEDMELSVRAYNCLKKANFNTLNDILALGDTEEKIQENLIKIKNMGEKACNEIIVKIAEICPEPYEVLDHIETKKVQELLYSDVYVAREIAGIFPFYRTELSGEKYHRGEEFIDENVYLGKYDEIPPKITPETKLKLTTVAANTTMQLKKIGITTFGEFDKAWDDGVIVEHFGQRRAANFKKHIEQARELWVQFEKDVCFQRDVANMLLEATPEAVRDMVSKIQLDNNCNG